MFLRRDKEHLLVKGNLGLGTAENSIHLLPVDTDRGDRTLVTFLIKTPKNIVEAYRLAGILLKTHYRETPMTCYFVYERQLLS